MMNARSTSTQRPLPAIRPKNGKFLVLLLAGGPADRARELRAAFAERRGALLKYHWPYHTPRAWQKPIPHDVDLVVMLRSMMGHSDEILLRKAVEAAEVPIVKTVHKWGLLDAAIRNRFRIGRAPPLPLNVSSSAYLREEDDAPAAPAAPEKAPRTLPPEVVSAPPAAPGILRIGPTLEERAAEIVKAAPGAHPSVETLALLLAAQVRMRLEGVRSVLLAPNELTIDTGAAQGA